MLSLFPVLPSVVVGGSGLRLDLTRPLNQHGRSCEKRRYVIWCHREGESQQALGFSRIAEPCNIRCRSGQPLRANTSFPVSYAHSR